MSHIFVLCIWAPAGLKCHRKSMPRTSFWTEIKIWQAQRISSLHIPWNGVKITKTNMPRWCCCLLCVKCPTFLCFAFGRLLAWNVTVNPCLAPHDPIKFQKWCDSSILRPFPGFTGPVPLWIQRFVTSMKIFNCLGRQCRPGQYLKFLQFCQSILLLRVFFSCFHRQNKYKIRVSAHQHKKKY